MELTIGDLKELLRNGEPIKSAVITPPIQEESIKIVILQRGWVVVGRYQRIGDEVRVRNASVVRVWGTKKGLGEICGGPTEKTVLDKCGDVRCPHLGVVATMDCNQEAWQPLCS